MKFLLFVLFIVCIFINAGAQKLNVALIPDSLKTNANVIKRYEEYIMEIKSPSKVITHERHVYTLLNENADEYSNYKTYYNGFDVIDYLSGILYDADGKELKKIKNKDVPDFSYNDNFSLINDTRYKRISFYNKIYPYTVDFEEDDTKDGVLNFNDWFPATANDMSVEFSKYVIIAHKNYKVRYKELNLSGHPIITEKGDTKIYTWEIKNFPAHNYEILSPSWYTLAPRLITAPSEFEAQGYKGNMSSWKSYGDFMYQLKKGRDILPSDIKQTVHSLTDELKTPKEKINVLYHYLQENTHYISVQLGIGGWQPFEANYVATKKYGDCKALSNYMIALLKEAGINGKYVEIKADANAPQIITDFPMLQFNHVICCVPLQKDTVWLECTDQNMPTGYLSDFTQDRWGLLSDETGGHLVHTPKYGIKENIQNRKIEATINSDGDLITRIETHYSAMLQDKLSSIINNYSNDKILEYLKRRFDLPTYDIVKFNYLQQKEIIPTVKESLEINVKNYAQFTGKRIFINPNILSRFNKRLVPYENRINDFVLHNEAKEEDSVIITIPTGYQIESSFKNVNINTVFGKYNASLKMVGNKLIYIRAYENYSGQFTANNYTSLINFYEQLFKADHTKVVLVKQEL